MTPLEREIISKLVEADYDDGNHPVIDEVIAMLRGPKIAVPYTVENYVKLAKHLTEEMDTEGLREITYTWHLNGYEKSERQFREDWEQLFGEDGGGYCAEHDSHVDACRHRHTETTTDRNGLTPGVDYTHGDYCSEHDCHALQCGHEHRKENRENMDV